MAYSNAVFFLDLESGSDTARTALTAVAVANNGSGLVRCTKAAHGLVSGAVGTASLNYAGDWKITVIDADSFDLIGSTYSTATALTFTPFGGSSKADAWKTYTTGATAARIAPGDIIRVKASPDETLVGNAVWTNLSKIITLVSAVTASVSDCETPWTASANVTVTADTASYKEATKSMKAVIAAAFTTGKVCYFATGTLDLSAYQQLSFWLTTTVAFPVSNLSIRLCSDTTGDVTVHTVPVPAKPDAASWAAYTVDLAADMNAAIASVALYVDVDFGAVTINLDSLIACKASSAPDALSLTSLIGKTWNLPWAASTVYAANTLRRPSQPMRNGFLFKVTAGGGGASGADEPAWPQEYGITVTDGALTWTCFSLEETWYPIQSISGTTVRIDNGTETPGNAGRGYAGATETVATYKREPIKQAMTTNFSSINTGHTLVDSGTFAAPITFTGGWNRTDMTTKTGETWTSCQSGWGAGLSAQGAVSSLNIDNICGTRGNHHIDIGTGGNFRLTNIHANGQTNAAVYMGGSNSTTNPANYLQNVVVTNTAATGLQAGPTRLIGSCITTNGAGSGSSAALLLYTAGYVELNYVAVKNNAAAGAPAISISLSGNQSPVAVFLRNVTSADNAQHVVGDHSGRCTLTNYIFNEAVPFISMSVLNGAQIYSHRHGGAADSHYIHCEGGSIASATDQRHTASGISWRFRPTATTRNVHAPLRLSVAKVACAANIPVTLSIWTRRDNINIVGTLRMAGGQLSGLPNDVTVNCTPAINTWVQSATLTVTPTETGVIEVVFDVYDGVGTANNFWIDDLVIS